MPMGSWLRVLAVVVVPGVLLVRLSPSVAVEKVPAMAVE